jgi:hypothetical protein
MSLSLAVPAVRGQDAPVAVESSEPVVRLNLGGTLQARLGYGHIEIEGADNDLDRLVFGLRRARLRADVRVGPYAGAFVQVDGATGTVQGVDAYVYYHLNERVRLRLGRLVSAQPRAAFLTPHTRLDALDRAAIAERWAAATLGPDGRDFGLDARYLLARGDILLFLHNGDGSWDRLRGNFRDGISGGQATGGADRTSMAVSLYGRYEPTFLGDLDVGAFLGYNARSTLDAPAGFRGRGYASSALHAYWGAEPGSRPFRVKADLITTRYEALDGVDPDERLVVGLALLGAMRLRPDTELFARYETYDPDADADRFVTAGASFSLSALLGRPYYQERVTLAYSLLLPGDAAGAQSLVALQAQIVF